MSGIIGTSPNMKSGVIGGVSVEGDSSISSAIKMKQFTGTTPAASGSSAFAHGLPLGSILHISAVAGIGSGALPANAGANSTNAYWRCYLWSTNIYIEMSSNSLSANSTSYVVTVFYI